MEASQEGHLELVRYLLEARADVNATTGKIGGSLRYGGGVIPYVSLT